MNDEKKRVALETQTAAPYRDDPFDAERKEYDKKIAGLQGELRSAKDAADNWKRYYDGSQQEMINLKRDFASMPRAMSRFLLWFIFMPAWLLLGLALFVVPFVAYFKYHLPAAIFWCCVLGVISLVIQFIALANASEGKELS